MVVIYTMLTGSTAKPERDAAVLRRSSKQTKGRPWGWEPHQIRAEASWRASNLATKCYA
jgi:hypothetical protein